VKKQMMFQLIQLKLSRNKQLKLLKLKPILLSKMKKTYYPKEKLMKVVL